MEHDNRVVVLIDMDCFYCQVEEKLNPELKGKPIAVVQYNPWKGGGIIAVNYVARAMGVSRHMRGDEAKEKCPEIQLPSVPCLRGKADITKYRDAGKEVAKVLQRFTTLLERASIDEAYLDITTTVDDRLKTLNPSSVHTEMIPNTYALGYNDVNEFITDVHNYGSEFMEFDFEHAKRLLVGAVIVSEIRAAVYEETGYRCSAGIANNKILAKLVCGMNKPNKQTVLPKHSVDILYRTLSLKKVKHLGGKFGDSVCEVLRITTMAELQKFTERELQAKFDEKNGTWLYNIARGIDIEPVQARFNPKSIGCCKQLRGKSALINLDSLRKWLTDLGDEIEDRLEKDALENNRTPRQMVVSYTTQLPDGRDSSSSRSYNFAADDELCGELFSNKALELVMDSMEGVKLKDGEANRKLKSSITFLGISVGKFEDKSESKKIKRIVDYFGAGSSKDVASKPKDAEQKETQEKPSVNKGNKKCDGKEYVIEKFFSSSNKPEKSYTNDCLTSKTVNNSSTFTKAEPAIESTLDKQESFFAKYLIKGLDKVKKDDTKNLNEAVHSTTPSCEIINCGENSNDTEYSGSTINDEINKSIALFEEDPGDIARVSSMRQLLSTSNAVNEDNETPPKEEHEPPLETDIHEEPASTHLETFDCTECGKTLSIDMFETHADFHFALKLREEERQVFRNEAKEKSRKVVSTEDVRKKPHKEEPNKNDSSSISSFLVKIDYSVPTEVCSECGKRVPVEKVEEHMDFHEAQKLSRELNKKAVPGYFTSDSVKRKRKSVTSPLKKTKVPCKSIDSFFK